MSVEQRPAGLRATGLTLVEMLVTLVLLSLVALLLGQALAQLARVERLLEGSQLRSVAAAVRAEWLRQALEGLLPAALDSPARLRGGPRELSGTTTDAPLADSAGARPIRLRLRWDETQGQTRLEVDAAESPDGGTPVVLLSWPGDSGRLHYLDPQGRWHTSWPPPLGVSEALPRLLAVETGSPEFGLLVAAPRADATALPERRALGER